MAFNLDEANKKLAKINQALYGRRLTDFSILKLAIGFGILLLLGTYLGRFFGLILLAIAVILGLAYFDII